MWERTSLLRKKFIFVWFIDKKNRKWSGGYISGYEGQKNYSFLLIYIYIYKKDYDRENIRVFFY